ncbi:hypothetical protein [Dyella sp. RRB7]|uniref:hypothetical protein n=1 Tax=Dyella sp. RRB7 TaxID=2919502 RepID=UPI001FAA6435|nr:hypothetical protein [Dyella sp. RRB7]
MAVQSLSDYLSLAETLEALGVTKGNFCRAIEEGKVTLPAYLRSGLQPFLADFLSGLFHEPDSDKMNFEVAEYLGRDRTRGGHQLLSDLLDTRKDGKEWSSRHGLRAKLHLLKPWEGWFIAFPHSPPWSDWRNTAGLSGTECVIHPEQLGDDDVSVEGLLLNHMQPVGPDDPHFPHFALSGTVRLTPDTLLRWARSGRFASPVRVTPPSWWASEGTLIPWTPQGTPKNYFALRYPTTEGYTDMPATSLQVVPIHGWHDTPADDDLLFRREDVEVLQGGTTGVAMAGALSIADSRPTDATVLPGHSGRRQDAIAREIEVAIARMENGGTRASINQHTVMAELVQRAGTTGCCITEVADGGKAVIWLDDEGQQQKLTKEALKKRLQRRP